MMKNYISLIFIALTLSLMLSEQSYAQFTLATDNANEPAYSGGFGTGQNGGNGFTAWSISYGTNTGAFTGDPASDGMSNTGIGSNAFSFFSTGSQYLNATRGFGGLELNDELSFYWAMNFDAGSGSKGFDLKNGGTTVLNVNNAGNTNITTTTGTATTTYGTNAMLVTVKRVLADDYEFSMTSKSGGTTYIATFNSTTTVDNINIYTGNQNDFAGQRNIYFNNFEIKNDANFDIVTGTETYTKVFTGTGALNKAGSGILVLSGNHTYTGTTTVDAGVLKLQGNLTNSDVIVKSGSTLELDGNITIKSITVEAGGYVKVNSGNTLTVTNDLILESTSQLYSSLISDGTIIGTVSYKRHVNGNTSLGDTNAIGNNDLISPPLSGQTFGAFASANSNLLTNPSDSNEKAFAPFDKGTGEYENYLTTTNTNTTLNASLGYRAATTNSSTLTFTGTVNTGTITNNIVNSGPSYKDWNLVGNPYPSYLKVQDFLNYEVASGVKNLDLFVPNTAAIYGYDGDATGTGTTGYTIYNLANTTAATVITPGQGFLVSANTTNVSAYDLTFVPAMRTTGISDDFIVGRSANDIINLELKMTSPSDEFGTDFYFNENATLGLDPGYDASFLGNTPAFALYSHLVEENMGNPFMIQTLGDADYENTTIALGVNANQGEQLTFKISINTLPSTVEIHLDDIVANTSTLLNSSDYIITPIEDLNGTGRFYLRVSNGTLSTPQNTLDNLSIYSNPTNKTVVISGQILEASAAKIYDIQGRQVSTLILQHTNRQQTIDVSSLSAGVYVIHIINGTLNKTQKVIIR